MLHICTPAATVNTLLCVLSATCPTLPKSYSSQTLPLLNPVVEYSSGKAKAEAERLAAMRAQLLAQAAAKGITLEQEEAEEAAEAADKKPKKVVYATKKQLQRKKSETKSEAADAAVEEMAVAEREQPEAAAAVPAEVAAADVKAPVSEPVKEESEGLDDWEQVAGFSMSAHHGYCN